MVVGSCYFTELGNDSLLYNVFIINRTASDICTLSLHDALPILIIVILAGILVLPSHTSRMIEPIIKIPIQIHCDRSEEHTSELQSRGQLVCRLLLEKKNIFRNLTCQTEEDPLAKARQT